MHGKECKPLNALIWTTVHRTHGWDTIPWKGRAWELTSVWNIEIIRFVAFNTIFVYIARLSFIYTICFVLFPQGNDFAKYIEERKPLVFTRETTDPYVCNNGGTNGLCYIRFSEALKRSGIPEGVSGPSCDNVVDCNDQTFGDI